MCVVSFVGDHYNDKWKPFTSPVVNPDVGSGITYIFRGDVTRKEFEELKKEVLEMKELLIAAKKIDEVTGQPDCEMEEKVAVLKKIAEFVGVDLSEVFGEN